MMFVLTMALFSLGFEPRATGWSAKMDPLNYEQDLKAVWPDC